MDFTSESFSIINQYFNNLGNQNGRRALIHLLGDNNNAIVAADILIYLIYQTFSTSEDYLQLFDGFIVRPHDQIELEVGCSNLNNQRIPLNILKESGLIETNNKSHKRKTCYRVNFELLQKKLETSLIEVDEMKKEYYRKQKEMKDNKWKKKNPIDWDHINDYLIEDSSYEVPAPMSENIDHLKSLGFKMNDIVMMFFVQKYWKEKYGVDYKWTQGEFNTLSFYLTDKGNVFLHGEKLKKLEDTISSLEEVDWMKKSYTAKKIVARYNGARRFSS